MTIADSFSRTAEFRAEQRNLGFYRGSTRGIRLLSVVFEVFHSNYFLHIK